MLSDRDIKNAVENQEISIEPFTSEHLRPSGIVFHLGDNLLKPGAHSVVDVRTGQIPDYESIAINLDQPYILQPREFILGQTLEKVSLSSRYSLMIEGRSTLARLGLTIVQTATLVYPGHSCRSITLELANHGPFSIKLFPAMKIARGMFFQLLSPASYEYDTRGKYQNQTEVGTPIFDDEVNAHLLKDLNL